MKKILLVDASPRVNGNSESVVNMLAEVRSEMHLDMQLSLRMRNSFFQNTERTEFRNISQTKAKRSSQMTHR